MIPLIARQGIYARWKLKASHYCVANLSGYRVPQNRVVIFRAGLREMKCPSAVHSGSFMRRMRFSVLGGPHDP